MHRVKSDCATFHTKMMTAHLHRPRPKSPRPPLVQTTKVTGPYRAEHRKKKFTGAWRKNIEEAFADAKLLGHGTIIVSSERILLAKFENAMRLAGPERERPKRGMSLDEGVLDEDE
jgi:hypothetical protein